MSNKYRWQRLAGILSEQNNVPTTTSTVPLEPVERGLEQGQRNYSNVQNVNKEPKDKDFELKNWLAGYCSYLRAIHLWFHAAHHFAKGTGFAGDHASLYERIYTEVQDETDGALEKSIAIAKDEHVACPIMLANNAARIMLEAGCEANVSADEIANAGLRLEKRYLDFVKEMFESLEEMELLSLGLNDQLASSANSHETYVYLLEQRVK